MSPHNSQLVACGGEVVVTTTHNAAAMGDVAAVVGIVVVVGAWAAVVVWVQRCLMRPCTSSQFYFVLEVVTSTGKEPSW